MNYSMLFSSTLQVSNGFPVLGDSPSAKSVAYQPFQLSERRHISFHSVIGGRKFLSGALECWREWDGQEVNFPNQPMDTGQRTPLVAFG